MKRTFLISVLVLCAFGASAGTITSISPSTVKVNSGEHFITIYGSGLGTNVVFDGPAGHYELPANATFTGNVVFWVPEAIVRTSGVYTVYVTGGTGTSNSVTFTVQGFKYFPLVIFAPDILRLQAESREGAYVKYDVIAGGGEDPYPVVECYPASGEFFRMGATTVDCIASNRYNESAKASFTVLVADGIGPRFEYLPDAITVKADSREGAKVAYDVKAWDDIWGETIPECLPRSGDVFPVGVTNVLCVATDLDGNVSTASFPVEVIGEREYYELTLTVPDIRVEAFSPEGEKVEWKVNVEGTEDGDPLVTCSAENGSLFPIGVTAVECTALDAWGMRGHTVFTVDVVDPKAPDIEKAYASPDVLRADGLMYPVEVVVGVYDNFDPRPHCYVFSVTSNQKISTGDNEDPEMGDWRITGDLTVELRAEYTKYDRYYDVWVTCSDFYGNALAGTARVVVPGGGSGDSAQPASPSKRRSTR